MGVTEVSSESFLSDIVIFLRDRLADNVDDPIANKRGTDKFILTEYPQRNTLLPVITITDTGTGPSVKLGMQSEGEALRVNVEIRIWAKNVVERDKLFNEIYDFLRSNQHSGNLNSVDANMYDYRLESTTNVSETGIRSKIIEVSYLILTC